MSNNKVLVQWYSNWADEMDVEGFQILTDREWEVARKNILSHTDEFTICIGTNEEIDYDNGQALMEDLTVTPISYQEAGIIEKFFGDYGGYTLSLIHI
jgi:hypothetical protein